MVKRDGDGHHGLRLVLLRRLSRLVFGANVGLVVAHHGLVGRLLIGGLLGRLLGLLSRGLLVDGLLGGLLGLCRGVGRGLGLCRRGSDFLRKCGLHLRSGRRLLHGGSRLLLGSCLYDSLLLGCSLDHLHLGLRTLLQRIRVGDRRRLQHHADGKQRRQELVDKVPSNPPPSAFGLGSRLSFLSPRAMG